MEWDTRTIMITLAMLGNLIWLVWVTAVHVTTSRTLVRDLKKLDGKLGTYFTKFDSVDKRETAHFSDIRVAFMAFAQRSGNPGPDQELVRIAENLGKKRNGG